MNRTLNLQPSWLLSAAAAAVLAACGGSGNDTPMPTPTPEPLTVAVSGKAVDGPLQGAIACYDLNDNGACDSGEPASAASDADGNFSLAVPTAEAGKHRVVVDVPASAIDKDTGAAVGTAFRLVTPATGTAGAQAVFVSPLTTLVQAHIDSTGVALAEASDFVKAQAGLGISPLDDFTAAGDAQKQAALLARLVQKTVNEQAKAVADAVGRTDLSGGTVSAADLEQAVAKTALGVLQSLAALAADPALAAASGSAREDALAAAASQAVAQAGLSSEAVVAAAGVAKLPGDVAPAAATPEAGASLLALRYTDADNWFVRTLESSAADNVPDAANKLRYYSVYRQSESSGFSPNGVVYAWGSGGSRDRAGDLHWTGSAWAACLLGSRSNSTVRDAQGRSSYDYCDGFEQGNTIRHTVDIAGKSVSQVFGDTIRKFPGGNGGVKYADWGPADLSAFGAATFPDGSKLQYLTQTPTKAAFAFDARDVNAVFAYSAEIAAGGDARSAGGLACAAANVAASAVTTLEDMLLRNPGQPCVFGKNTSGADSSLDPNEWWSNSTASLGVVSGGNVLPAGTGHWYITDQRLRVAFTGAGNGTKYYGCLSRANGSSRNCTLLGSGSYTIQTLGDARTMSFNGLPAVVAKTGYTRVFVERGGKVYYGYQNPVGVTTDYLRLNLQATNAVFAPLGIGAVRPVTRASDFSADKQKLMADARGVWVRFDDSSALVLRFGEGGRFALGAAGDNNPALREQPGTEVGWIDIDPASGKFARVVEVDSDLSGGTSHPSATSALHVSADLITNDEGETLQRMPSVPGGMVGLWALDSATEFKTQQFAFFPNGKLLMLDPIGDDQPGACLTARQGPPGAEFSSWTFEPTTNRLHVFGKLVDTNGCAGLFDSSAGAVAGGTANTEAWFAIVFSVDGSSATATNSDSGEVNTIYRVPSR